MRWQYAHLNETPYLYSSKELRKLYRNSNGKKETNAIADYMEKHEVFNHREYKGYIGYRTILWMICMKKMTKFLIGAIF